MNWSNVKLIWLREVRDQLRDRRTLFLIAVLPLLLYPLLGMSFIQVSQFLGEHPTRVLLVGLTDLPGMPPLVEKVPSEPKATEPKATEGTGDTEKEKEKKEKDSGKKAEKAGDAKNGDAAGAAQRYQFASQWLSEAEKADPRLLVVDVKPAEALGPADPNVSLESRAKEAMRDGEYDAIVCFPPDFSERLEAFRQSLVQRQRPQKHPGEINVSPEVPSPQIYFNSARDRSQVAFLRVDQVLRGWQDAIGQQNLKESNVPATAVRPFSLPQNDVAEPTQRTAALWSKILPFVLLIWALTGAFYPAVDLCAGEKERGTLETLLSSPAERTEIVAGKLLTVMVFSMATSLLNLASLGLTGLLVMRQVGALHAGMPTSLPPWSALPWLVVALVPVSALFSALCLALAVFARSSKEGQYYLMPLVLITMPLLILPMSPGVELTLGNSFIPLSGLLLLLRMLLEGNGWEALPFVPPVALSTGLCCYLAMRWAVDQFNSETVLFREGERLDLRLRLSHMIRSRGATPTVGAALACGVLILVAQFFVPLVLAPWIGSLDNLEFAGAARLIVISMLTMIVPATLMTGCFTRKPAQTLLLRGCSPWALLAALVLAVAVQPVAMAAQSVLQWLYPLGRGTQALESVAKALQNGPNWWLPLVLIGLLPAVCEEFTFRGFVLSGLRHSGHKWRAILVSALFFAVAHQVFQQSVWAFVMGTMLAYIAVQASSIWPGLLIHCVYNSLALLIGEYRPALDQWIHDNPTLRTLAPSLGWFAFLFGALIVMWILAWFSRLPYSRTKEEQVEEAIAEETAGALHV